MELISQVKKHTKKRSPSFGSVVDSEPVSVSDLGFAGILNDYVLIIPPFLLKEQYCFFIAR